MPLNLCTLTLCWSPEDPLHKLNVKELNCVKNKGIGGFIHVVLAVPPRARGQLLAVSFGKFHSHNIAFPSTRDFLSASAKQLRFLTAL